MSLYKILIIDLKEKKKEIQYIDKKISDFYMGGLALCIYWLKKNKVKDFWGIFSSSLINYKNPISKYIICRGEDSKITTYSSLGGDFSYYLKSNLYDALVLLNKADSLYDIYINGGEIKFDKINSDLSNNFYSKLKETYGPKTSSIYITKSSERGDKLSRLLIDKYRGCSKNLSNHLYKKNIRSITVKEDKPILLKLDKEFNSNCDGCLIGCKSIKKRLKSKNLFSKKDSYKEKDLILLDRIKKRLDQYGIDIFGLSKSIEFAYENLNQIYNFKDLSLNSLDYISKNITSNKKDVIYEDISQGRDFLREKYGFKKDFKNKKIKDSEYLKKVIDSICICLFSVKIDDIDDIVKTINYLSNKTYKKYDINALIDKIKKMEAL